jgi:3-hydroxymyristoyl/3-hydroxydecanoyl-(acyl carrier protein) dehydratase
VEAFAQTGAVCVLTAPTYIGKTGYFSSIQEVKFKLSSQGKICQGDQ